MINIKNRLKVLSRMKSEDEGVIIRTICEGKDKEIVNEYKKLSNME